MSYSIFSYKRRFSNLFKSIATTNLKFKTILGNNTALCLRKVKRYSTVSHIRYILVNTLQLLEADPGKRHLDSGSGVRAGLRDLCDVHAACLSVDACGRGE